MATIHFQLRPANPNDEVPLYTIAVRQETEAKEKEVQDKIAEIKLLQRQKAEVERIRHTDIVKLRLEVWMISVTWHILSYTYPLVQYDAKMLKLQKQQNTRAQQVAQPSSSNDIFRKV